MAATKFRAVVFDYGGTLTDPYRDAMMAFAAQRPHLPPAKLRELFHLLADPIDGQDTLALRSERGEVDLTALVAFLDELHPGAGDLVRTETTPFAHLGLNPHMAELHDQARAAGLKTAVLSNIYRGLETLYRLDHQHWDEVVFSSLVGMRKPDPQIYRHVCERLDVAPEQALYLDDLTQMCAGAEAVGMTAVLVDDHASAAEEARRLLGLSPA